MEESMARKKKFKVNIDDEIFEFENPIVTGNQLLEIAGKTPLECYSLYQKLEGCDFEKISIDEKVDLSKPGIEKFVIKEPEVFYYTIDGESEATEKKSLTAIEILELNNMNGKDYYLVLIEADGSQLSFENNPNESIVMKCPGLKFIAAYRSGTSVA